MDEVDIVDNVSVHLAGVRLTVRDIAPYKVEEEGRRLPQGGKPPSG